MGSTAKAKNSSKKSLIKKKPRRLSKAPAASSPKPAIQFKFPQLFKFRQLNLPRLPSYLTDPRQFLTVWLTVALTLSTFLTAYHVNRRRVETRSQAGYKPILVDYSGQATFATKSLKELLGDDFTVADYRVELQVAGVSSAGEACWGGGVKGDAIVVDFYVGGGWDAEAALTGLPLKTTTVPVTPAASFLDHLLDCSQGNCPPIKAAFSTFSQGTSGGGKLPPDCYHNLPRQQITLSVKAADGTGAVVFPLTSAVTKVVKTDPNNPDQARTEGTQTWDFIRIGTRIENIEEQPPDFVPKEEDEEDLQDQQGEEFEEELPPPPEPFEVNLENDTIYGAPEVSAQAVADTYVVYPIYFVPNDQVTSSRDLQAARDSLTRVRGWFSGYSGGRTFQIGASEAIRGDHSTSWYLCSRENDPTCHYDPEQRGDFMSRLHAELIGKGYRFYEPGKIFFIFGRGFEGAAFAGPVAIGGIPRPEELAAHYEWGLPNQWGYALVGDCALDSISNQFDPVECLNQCGGSVDEGDSTVAHELGHAFGLVHSPTAAAVMYPYCDNQALSGSILENVEERAEIYYLCRSQFLYPYLSGDEVCTFPYRNPVSTTRYYCGGGGAPACPDWRTEIYAGAPEPSNLLVVDNSVGEPGGNLLFDWGDSSPHAGDGVPVDNFSVRFDKVEDFIAGDYYAAAFADDAVDVWLAGGLLVDNCSLTSLLGCFPTVPFRVESGEHPVSVLFRDYTEEASFYVHWIGTERYECGGGGAPACPDWKTEVLVKLYSSDPPVQSLTYNSVGEPNGLSFDWGRYPPRPGMQLKDDNFLVRFTKNVYFAAGDYDFTARADDLINASVGGQQLIVDCANYEPGGVCQTTTHLESGIYPVAVEYEDHYGLASFDFHWGEVSANAGQVQVTGWVGCETPGEPPMSASGATVSLTVSGSGELVGSTFSGTGGNYQLSAAVDFSQTYDLVASYQNPVTGESWYPAWVWRDLTIDPAAETLCGRTELAEGGYGWGCCYDFSCNFTSGDCGALLDPEESDWPPNIEIFVSCQAGSIEDLVVDFGYVSEGAFADPTAYQNLEYIEPILWDAASSSYILSINSDHLSRPMDDVFYYRPILGELNGTGLFAPDPQRTGRLCSGQVLPSGQSLWPLACDIDPERGSGFDFNQCPSPAAQTINFGGVVVCTAGRPQDVSLAFWRGGDSLVLDNIGVNASGAFSFTVDLTAGEEYNLRAVPVTHTDTISSIHLDEANPGRICYTNRWQTPPVDLCDQDPSGLVVPVGSCPVPPQPPQQTILSGRVICPSGGPDPNGVAGLNVTLREGDWVVQTVATNSSGYFNFSNYTFNPDWDYSIRPETTNCISSGTYEFQRISADGTQFCCDAAVHGDICTPAQSGGNPCTPINDFKLTYHICDANDLRSGNCGTPPPDPQTVVRAGCRREGSEIKCLEWKGELYDNRNLDGDPVVVRNFTDIHNRNWGAGTPDELIPADKFSIRLTRNILFDGGDYVFNVTSDDGVRIKLLDEWILWDWTEGSHQHTVRRYVPPGNHLVTIEYFERFGNASLHFDYQKDCSVPTLQINSPVGGEIVADTRRPAVRVVDTTAGNGCFPHDVSVVIKDSSGGVVARTDGQGDGWVEDAINSRDSGYTFTPTTDLANGDYTVLAWVRRRVPDTVRSEPIEKRFAVRVCSQCAVPEMVAGPSACTADSTPTFTVRDSAENLCYPEATLFSVRADEEGSSEVVRQWIWNHPWDFGEEVVWTIPDDQALPSGSYRWFARVKPQGDSENAYLSERSLDPITRAWTVFEIDTQLPTAPVLTPRLTCVPNLSAVTWDWAGTYDSPGCLPIGQTEIERSWDSQAVAGDEELTQYTPPAPGQFPSTQPSGDYGLRVRFKDRDSSVWGDWSAWSEVTVDSDYPPSPTDLKVNQTRCYDRVELIPAEAMLGFTPAVDTGCGMAGLAYLVTVDEHTIPELNDPRWQTETDLTLTDLTMGGHTAYVWAKDGAGNLSGIAARVNFTIEPCNSLPICERIEGFTHLDPGEEVVYTIIATDPEGDPITYHWSINCLSSGLRFNTNTGTDNTLTWTAPNAPDTCQMVGMTRDDSGAGVSGCYEFRYSSFEIKVLPPLTCEIDPASFDLTAGESQALTANLTSDNDGETVNYFWGAFGYDDVGVFTRLLDQGDNQITWTATNFFGELLPESLYQLAVKLVDSLNPHRQGICTTTGNVSPL